LGRTFERKPSGRCLIPEPEGRIPKRGGVEKKPVDEWARRTSKHLMVKLRRYEGLMGSSIKDWEGKCPEALQGPGAAGLLKRKN